MLGWTVGFSADENEEVTPGAPRATVSQ